MSERHKAGNSWGWRHLLAAASLVTIAFLATLDTWKDIYHLATVDEESSHVFLVPIAVIWLVWVRRSRLRQCGHEGGLIGTAVLALGWFLWWFGYHHEVQAFWHAGAITIVVGSLLTVLGKDVLFNFLPAFAVLVFLVPVPGTGRMLIALPLQTATAQITQSVAEVLGMGVTREGNVLQIAGAQVAIAEACNGMRMVFTLFLACYLFAFVTPLRGYVRVLILALSPVTAIVCNVVRLIPTVWMFGHTSVATASRFHDVGGWVMLVLAFLGLMGMVKILRWALLPVTPFHLAGA